MLKNLDVISNYNSFSTQIQGTISKETSKNVLEKMLRLYIYIRVRSFSYAKDVNFKKILQTRTTDKKSLRANLKKKSDQEIRHHYQEIRLLGIIVYLYMLTLIRSVYWGTAPTEALVSWQAFF